MTTTMSLAELETESLELLPARETLCAPQNGEGGFSQRQGTFQVGLVNLNNSFNNNSLISVGSNANSGNQAG